LCHVHFDAANGWVRGNAVVVDVVLCRNCAAYPCDGPCIAFVSGVPFLVGSAVVARKSKR